MQLQTFYMGLTPVTKNLVNAASNESFMNQTEEASFNLLETMAMNNEGGGSERTILRRQAATADNNAIRALTKQVDTLSHQLQKAQLGVNAIASCQWCHGPHLSEAC